MHIPHPVLTSLLACIALFSALMPGRTEPWKHTPRSEAASPAHSAECICRARGREHGIGTEQCLLTPMGTALFRCEMDQNVTSWRKIAGQCPEA